MWNSHDPQASKFFTITMTQTFYPGTIFTSYAPLPPPPNDPSSPAKVTPIESSTACNSPTKPLPHIPNDPDPDPSSSYFSLSDSSESFYPRCCKKRQRTHNKSSITRRNKDPIKECAKFTAKLLEAAWNSKSTRFKFDEDTLQHRIYFLNLMNLLKIILSQFKQTYMLIIKYPSITGEDFPDDAKLAIWNLLHAYIDAHIQSLIYKYPGYGVQAIIRFQSQFADTPFADNYRYNRMFRQVFHKGGE